MPNCPSCGASLDADDSFCGYCGADVSDVGTSDQTAQHAQSAGPPPAASSRDQPPATGEQPGQAHPPQGQRQHSGQQPASQGGLDDQSRRTLLQAGAAIVGIGGVAYALQSDDITVPVLEDDGGADESDTGGGGTPTPESTSTGVGGSGDGGGSDGSDGGGSDDSGESGGGSGVYGGWLDDTSNYEATYDFTGFDEVTVAVGVDGNEGPYAFDPVAVLVDPGATVFWEWTGDGSGHSVTHEPRNGETERFDSPIYEESGIHFEYTFEERGTHRYHCLPHEAMGMKGVVAVGETDDELIKPEQVPTPTPGGEESHPSQDIRLFVPNQTERLQLLTEIASDHLGVSVQTDQVPPEEMLQALAESDGEGYTIGIHGSYMMQEFSVDELFEVARPVAQFTSLPAGLTVAPQYGETVDEFAERVQNESGQAVTVIQPDVSQTSIIAARILQEYLGSEQSFEIVRSNPQETFIRVREDEGIVATTAEPVWAPPELLEELNLLAVFGSERLSWRDDVPTFQEATGTNLPPMTGWEGIIAPQVTPNDRIDRLALAFERAAEHPDFRQLMRDNRLEPTYRPPDEFGDFLNGQSILYSEYGEL